MTENKGQHLGGPMRQARVARSCKAARVMIPRVEIALDERCLNGLSFVEDFILEHFLPGPHIDWIDISFVF